MLRWPSQSACNLKRWETISRGPGKSTRTGGKPLFTHLNRLIERLSLTGILLHPLVRSATIAFALTFAIHGLFFYFSQRLWALRDYVPIASVSAWARGAMVVRDGDDPKVLLLLVLVLTAFTVLATYLLDKLPVTWRAVAVALCLFVSIPFALRVPFVPPVAQVDSAWSRILVVEAGVLLAVWAVEWAGRRAVTYSLIVLLLIPICFLTASPQTISPDLTFILAPALRLRLWISRLHDIYFQYDLFPSLVAVAWKWLGADVSMFAFSTRISYFLLLGGCFVLARRLFAEKRLAAFLLIALCTVRIYGIIVEANTTPQVTALRVDLWILLLAAALHFGLEHWSVGLLSGLLFFARSFGMLYLQATRP